MRRRSEKDLYERAGKASHDYYDLYGSFPQKIGIHYKRFSEFTHAYGNWMAFHERTSLPVVWEVLDDPLMETVTYTRRIVTFELVIGEEVDEDDVYFPIPGDAIHLMSGAQVQARRERKEWEEHREERARESEEYRKVHAQLWRLYEAERQEEVDVCPDCYRKYLPMRRLHTIYPDWPPAFVPLCDYCEGLAKYHVKRSDWIDFSNQEGKDDEHPEI